MQTRDAIWEGRYRRAIACLGAALALAGCANGEAPSTSASTANQSQSQAQAQNPPAGNSIPAASGSTAATLSWSAPLLNADGSPLRDLTGFKIYYGQNANTMANSISIPNASVSTFIVENLTSGTWYFGVTAVNSQGFEGQISNLATKTIT